MKTICRAATLAVCLVALGGLTAQAQTDNTAYGTGALASNTTGSYDAAFGTQALHSNTTGVYNTAAGAGALQSNTTGGFNTATGAGALWSNTNGGGNTAFGVDALQFNTTGGYNAAFGTWALQSNTTGSDNTACGVAALAANTTGNGNTAYGLYALASNTTGGGNTAFGPYTLVINSTGASNTAYGDLALYSNTTGSNNTAAGLYALASNATGNNNIAIGYQAGYNTTGSQNIAIGNPGAQGDNGVIRIGQPGNHTSFYAAGVYGVAIGGPVPVYINSNGQLGTVNSSIRFKEDVHDMADASSGLLKLRPVTYRYKEPYADGSKPIDYGLIAEEVAEVYPDMVVRDADGQVQTVQYQKLTPMLLNEVQKQEQTIRRLEDRLAALEAASPRQ